MFVIVPFVGGRVSASAVACSVSVAATDPLLPVIHTTVSPDAYSSRQDS
jgi:hypothetical protein